MKGKDVDYFVTFLFKRSVYQAENHSKQTFLETHCNICSR